MIRVVLDTNIVVSALLQPLGPSARILVLVLSGAIQLCVTGDIYAEYEEVLRRPRLKLDENVIAASLEAIRLKGLWIKSPAALRVCSDPDDDIFVECAAAAEAAYLVTGNVKDFPPVWEKTRVVTPRHFVNAEFSEDD
jgi:uncharacterized protein